MATHRLQVVNRRPALRTALRNVLSMTRRTKILLAIRFAAFTVGMSTLLYLSVGPEAGTTWLVLALAENVVDALVWSADHQADLSAKENEKRMMDRLAGQPGGAPLVADVGGHCGCVHRYAWDEVAQEWRQVTVVELNKFCPLVEAYA